MKNISLIFFLASILMSCQSTNNSSKEKSKISLKEIPELMDRNEKLRYAQEWDQIQNNYVTQRNKIIHDSQDVEGLLKLAQIYIQEARVTGEHGHYYPAALSLLNHILENVPDLSKDFRFISLCFKAGVELSLHEFSGALSTAREALGINGHQAQIYGVLVDALVELGSYREAIEAADKMVSIRPDLRSYSRISYLRQIHGDLKGAIEAMQMAVEAGFPTYEETAWARLHLGELYELNGNHIEAEREYEAILEDRPNYPFALAALAKMEERKGKYSQAEHLYNEAIAIIPEVYFYIDKAKMLLKSGKHDECMSIMEEVKIMLHDDEEHGHNMDLQYSEIYLEIYKDFDLALKYAHKEYAKRPNNIEVNKILAKIYAQMDQKNLAKKYLATAMSTNVSDPELLELELKIS